MSIRGLKKLVTEVRLRPSSASIEELHREIVSVTVRMKNLFRVGEAMAKEERLEKARLFEKFSFIILRVDSSEGSKGLQREIEGLKEALKDMEERKSVFIRAQGISLNSRE